MATKTKTTVIVTNLQDMSKPERRQVLLDQWEGVNDEMEALKPKRLQARDAALAEGVSGKVYTASSGRDYLFVNKVVDTDSHAKVAQTLAKRLGLTDKQLKAEYEKVKGSRTVKEIKEVPA